MALAWNRRRSAAPHYDQTFGDKALSAACEDMVMGRWEGAHELLATSPHRDWDRRSHRIRLLAHTAADKRIVEAWQTAQPHSADALVLRADTEVMRHFAAARTSTIPGPDILDRTAHICLNAADAFPQDPHPWVSLITLGRLYENGAQAMNRWWPELLARDPYHREAHHQALRYMTARWHGSHGQAYAFARDCAVYAPAGSPLLVMPQVARAEEFRHRTENEGVSPHAMVGYWAGERWDLMETMERWIAVRSPSRRHRTSPTSTISLTLSPRQDYSSRPRRSSTCSRDGPPGCRGRTRASRKRSTRAGATGRPERPRSTRIRGKADH